jgi:hypothetical protein
LVKICRLVVTSVFVGTTATVVFKSSLPADSSQRHSLLSAVQEGAGGEAVTVSEHCLNEQVRKFKRPEPLRSIRSIREDAALLDFQERGRVASIMAEASRIQTLSRKAKEPSQHQISATSHA